jgi:hypothetical protein
MVWLQLSVPPSHKSPTVPEVREPEIIIEDNNSMLEGCGYTVSKGQRVLILENLGAIFLCTYRAQLGAIIQALKVIDL